MNAKNIIYQIPAPKVSVLNPDTGDEVLVFALTKKTNLLSYQFSLGTGDTAGSFSLTFFPEYRDENGTVHSLFDEIKKLYIVRIYEGNGSAGEKPVFTGIIRSKKYASQTTDGGGTRRLTVHGTAITGLINQYYVNLDTTACAITKQMVANDAIRNGLTTKILGMPAQSRKLKDIIQVIWEYFDTVNAQLTTPKVKEYLERFAGSIFDCDSTEFAYPLGCVFDGNSTQDFYSIIDGIVPAPVYEKFSWTGSDGVTKVKIRRVPFMPEDWQKLPCHKLAAKEIRSFDFSESDSEVYTVFFAYLNGYPVQEDKALKLTAMNDERLSASLEHDSTKYKVYGYRLLSCHFLGYGKKDGETDTSTEDKLKEINTNLKKWFGRLDEMLKGSVTLAMTYGHESAVMPGEKVSFLGGEFYVEGVSHNWSYGSGGDISLSLSRGGKYDNGSFAGSVGKITDIAGLLESGVETEQGD